MMLTVLSASLLTRELLTKEFSPFSREKKRRATCKLGWFLCKMELEAMGKICIPQ